MQIITTHKLGLGQLTRIIVADAKFVAPYWIHAVTRRPRWMPVGIWKRMAPATHPSFERFVIRDEHMEYVLERISERNFSKNKHLAVPFTEKDAIGWCLIEGSGQTAEPEYRDTYTVN